MIIILIHTSSNNVIKHFVKINCRILSLFENELIIPGIMRPAQSSPLAGSQDEFNP